MSTVNGPLDPDKLALLKAVFEEACALLPPRHQDGHEIRSHLASSILQRGAQGGLSPAQLRMYALAEVVSLTGNSVANGLGVTGRLPNRARPPHRQSDANAYSPRLPKAR